MTIVRISILHQEPLRALTTTSASPCSALHLFRHMLSLSPSSLVLLTQAALAEHMHIYGADMPPLSISDGYSLFFASHNDANPATHTFVTSSDIVTAMASTHFPGTVQAFGDLYMFLVFINPNHTNILCRCRRIIETNTNASTNLLFHLSRP
ncbi:hypothetical protein M405DRAFT_248074 [Rhizopogon salebrosus TDB-379]|nr:hypothetical protein M405DRAFT_248074 [Rhizopogon salebrosus TDB-379]